MHLNFLRILLFARKKLGITDAEFFSITPSELDTLLKDFNESENAQKEFDLKLRDTYHAELLSTVINCHKQKGGAVDPKKFLRFVKRDIKSPEEILAKVKAIHQTLSNG